MVISGLRGFFVAVAAVACFFLLGSLLLDSRYDSSVFNAIRVNNNTLPNDYYALRAADDNALRNCELREFPDGWTDEALDIVDPYTDPLAKCNRNFTPLTELFDSRVRLLKNGDASRDESLACRARAILWKKDLDYSAGNWVNIAENPKFPHDAVHVQCAKEPTNFTDKQIIYSFVHQQIYRNRSVEVENARAAVAEREKKRAVRPSVHVILIDSLGNTAMIRTMPRTVGFLKGELGAVAFRHINKVGLNSRPNGAAFLLGMQLADFDRSLLGLPSVPAEYKFDFFCKHLDLDAQKMVIREFEKQRGYVTMISDDWSQGVFNYPFCNGYQKMPSTHYNRPYQLAREKIKAVAETMSKKNCMPPWLAQLEYLEMFINEYPDDPKTSLSWLSTLAHNSNEDAFSVDGLFHDFLEKNRNEFEDSFVFFMSDHGLRFGKALMKNMRKNAGKLLTQFDVHATFIDLIESLPSSNFSDFAMLPPKKTGRRGSSLFRPLPEGPRNCFTLPIPFEFCMCNLEFIDVKEDFVKTAAEKAVVNRINQLIGARNFTALCHYITEAKATSVKTVKGTNGLFRVRVKTTPGGGEFEAWLRDVGARGSPFFIAASASLSRLNEYGKAADCLESTGTEDMRPLCFCKQNKTGRRR